MPRLGDTPDHFAIAREFSTDRRLALDWMPFPDPRSQWELDNPESVLLRDAETGAVLGDFGGWTMIAAHDWPAEGGVALRLPREIEVTIAPDLATFTTSRTPTPRPIADLPDWLRSLIPPPPPPLPPPSLLSRVATWGMLAGLLALLVFGFTRLPPVRALIADLRGISEAERGTGGINAWIVRCPDIGRAMMSLDADGHLRVPAAIAPRPLPPLDETGRRFGDGRVVVEVDGTEINWWPQGPGGAPVSCRSSVGEGR